MHTVIVRLHGFDEVFGEGYVLADEDDGDGEEHLGGLLFWCIGLVCWTWEGWQVRMKSIV